MNLLEVNYHHIFTIKTALYYIYSPHPEPTTLPRHHTLASLLRSPRPCMHHTNHHSVTTTPHHTPALIQPAMPLGKLMPDKGVIVSPDPLRR